MSGEKKMKTLPCVTLKNSSACSQPSEERVLLSNEFGSPRYTQFLHGLGQMISLEEAEKDKLYLGGLNFPTDGKFSVAWQDESLRGELDAPIFLSASVHRI